MAVATTAVMIVVVVVPISAVVVLVLIVILLVVVLLLLLMVMHLLGILLCILQPVPDGGIVLATSAAATTSSTTIIHSRGHSTQDRMVQVIVERRRRVTHASHRKATRETALVVQARNLRLLLLLVGRHSLLLRVVLVRKLGLLLVMVVVGVTYILIIAITVMSHRGARPVDLQIPEPIVEVRFGDYVRAAAVDHRWSAAAVRGTFVAKVWHRSPAVRSSASATPSAAVVPSEPRVVTTAVLRLLLLLRRGGLLGHEYRRVCGEVVASGRPQRGKARFGTALPLATSALLIHADCSSCCFASVLLFLLRSVQTESVLFSTIILCVTPWHSRKHS